MPKLARPLRRASQPPSNRPAAWPLAARILITLLLAVGLWAYLGIEALAVFRYRLLLILLASYAGWTLWTKPAQNALFPITIVAYLLSFWLLSSAIAQLIPFWFAILCLLLVVSFITLADLSLKTGNITYPPPAALLISLITTTEATILLSAWQTHPSNRAIILTLGIILLHLWLFRNDPDEPLQVWPLLTGAALFFLLIVVTMKWGSEG